DRLRHEVRLAAPSEAAAEVLHVNLYARGRNPEHGRCGRLRRLRVLRSTPDLATLIGHLRGAVHRLHARVREIRNLVSRLDALRRSRKSGLNIPIVASHDTRLI